MVLSSSSCYFSSLEGTIAVRAGFHAILTCGPVKTSFQVDIEIYEDKLGQSRDKVRSGHITNISIIN